MNDLLTHPLTAEPWPSGHAIRLGVSNEAFRRREVDSTSPSGDPSFGITVAPSTTGAMVVIGTASPVVLYGLQTLVSETPGLRLAGTASSLSELLECCMRIRDGVVLVDPFLGGQSIRAFMGILKATAPRIRAVLIADGNQPHKVREAVTSGACAFVGQAADAEEIRSALAAAADGRRYISSGSATHLADSLVLQDLTLREMQVLGLLAKGECNKGIARVLDVSLGTVKTHVRAIMSKLGSRSRTEAVHKAYRLGLVCLDS
jgi:DNA-binding NarL/FixJ family response regulator